MAHELRTASTEGLSPTNMSANGTSASPNRYERDPVRYGPQTGRGAGRLVMLALVPITVLATTSAATSAAGASTTSHKAATHSAAPAKESLAYYNNHPCSLLSRS